MVVAVRQSCLFVALLFVAAVAQAQADLSVQKTGPDKADPGDNVPYVVIVTNNGPNSAANVTLTDEIPEKMTFFSRSQDNGPAFLCTDPGSGQNGTISCTAPALLAGESAQFTFTFTIINAPNDVVPGTEFVNTATVSSTTADPDAENNASSATTTTHAGDMVISKTGPDMALLGEDVTYVITVTNNGPDTANNITVTDMVPFNTEFVSATADDGPPAACSGPPQLPAAQNVVCTTPTLEPGESAQFTLVFNIDPQAPEGTIISNSATVTSSNDPEPENNNAFAVTFTPAEPQADLVVTKTGPTAAPPDSDVTYTITLRSNGPSTATNVTLTDELPTLPPDTFMTFVSLDQTGTGLSCTTPAIGAGGTITCTIDEFPADGMTTLTLVAHIPADAEAGDEFANTAFVTSDADPTSENDESTANLIVSSVDISVVKTTGQASVLAGGTIAYTLTVTNFGPDDTLSATLTDAVPAGATFQSFTQDTGPAAGCIRPLVGDSTGEVQCFMPLGANQSATFTLVLNATGGTPSITNIAVVSTGSFDTNADNDESSVTTPVTPVADLSVTKTGPATVTAGEDIAYTITVINGGPSLAANVSLTDLVPAGTTFVSMMQNSGPAFACVANGTVTCTIDPMPLGSAVFTLTVHVPSSGSGTVENQAAVASPTTDPDSGDRTSALVVTTIETSADLNVTKTAPAVADAGSNITFAVTVHNAGPSDASSVTLTDVIPAGTTFVSANQTSGPTFNCSGGPTITCTIATMPALTTATFDFVVTIDPTTTGSFDNTATVAAATADPNGDDNTSTATVAIDPGPTDLAITKTASDGPYGVGAPVTYTIVVTNNGPSTAFGVTATDPLPAGTTYQSSTTTQGSCSGTTTVVCNLGTLDPLDSATITLTVFLPPSPGNVSNTATVSAANDETSGDDNAATVALAVAGEIPTLSTYALALLALVLAVIAARMVKMQ